MPVTYARVTGTATAQGGLAVTSKITARPLTTNELLRHPTEGLLVGRWEGLVYPDGTIHDSEDGALGLRIPLGVTPANPWWVFELEVPDQRHGTTRKWLGSAVVTQDVGINDLLQINLTAVSKDIADDTATARDEAVTAAADAEAAKVAAQAVGTTNDAVIAGRVNDPASATTTALTAKFAGTGEGVPLLLAKVREMAGRINTPLATVPAVASSPVTVTYGNATLWANGGRTYRPEDFATVIGASGNVGWDAGTGKSFAGNGVIGLDFYADNDVEVGWVCQNVNADRVWVFIDGVPQTARPTAAPLATSPGNFYYAKIALGAGPMRRVTVRFALVNALLSAFAAAGTTLKKAPARPRIGIVGDSYTDTSGASGGNPITSYPLAAMMALGVDARVGGIGGTGYTTAQPFGTSARVTDMLRQTPDLLVFMGSVNDDGQAGIQAAATACYNAYAAAMPQTPMIVIGPQSSSAVATVATNRAANVAAVKAAADAHPNVIAFIDMVGTGSTGVAPPAYSSAVAYAEGALVASFGSVWRWSNSGVTSGLNPGTPGTNARWKLMTAVLTGTGRVGETVGDGNRDTMFGSFALGDNVHWSQKGHDDGLAPYVAEQVHRAITEAAAKSALTL